MVKDRLGTACAKHADVRWILFATADEKKMVEGRHVQRMSAGCRVLRQHEGRRCTGMEEGRERGILPGFTAENQAGIAYRDGPADLVAARCHIMDIGHHREINRFGARRSRLAT